MMNIWPPFLGAGIRVKEIDEEFKFARVELKSGLLNRNYVGTHYGGSLFSMTDPFYMLMLLHNLGKDYIVWDKAAEINYKKPGKGRLRADFNLTSEQIEEIRHQADTEYKAEPEFTVEILDEEDDVVAEVKRVLYVRRKDRDKKPATATPSMKP